MKNIETFFTGTSLTIIVAVMAAVIWTTISTNTAQNSHFPTTDFGAFLASQHAIYINDFETADRLSSKISNQTYPVVQNTRYLSQFLSGTLPENIEFLEKEKATAAKLIYDAYLVTKDDWKTLYKRHNKDESPLAAPLRIWSSVATNKRADALKFIEKLPTNSSWRDFVRGQIYAETGDVAKAAESFAKVRPEFMNINDYMYIMSFYRANNMTEQADLLHLDFTARPGGMFMLNFDKIPDWSVFSGYRNALAFSLIQNVSHTQAMMYSDLSILLLRFAEITGPSFNKSNDSINYYLGQFFFNNMGDYAKYFNNIPTDSPYYTFGVLRIAEKSGNISDLKRAVAKNPLFVPAVIKLIAYDIQHNNKRSALRTVNRALKNKNLTDTGRAFFLKSRAQIYYTFGDFKSAQQDIYTASKTLPLEPDILSLQAKIWIAQNRNLGEAYNYAMMLLTQHPTDILSWDTLGRVVAVREGIFEALDVLDRVSDVARTCSSLFEQLGDLYVAIGDTENARDAYLRAIELSDDGMVIISKIQKKLRKLK